LGITVMKDGKPFCFVKKWYLLLKYNHG
jgi:hypothetical protein